MNRVDDFMKDIDNEEICLRIPLRTKPQNQGNMECIKGSN